MKKYIIRILIITISFINIAIYSKAASNASVELVPSTSSIEAGKNISININIENNDMAISGFDCFINYNENIFDIDSINTDIPEENIETQIFNNNTKKLMIVLTECMENIKTIGTINLKVKDNIEVLDKTDLNLSHINIYNVDEDIFSIEDGESNIINLFVEEDNSLYLKSKEYKIGKTKEQEIDSYKVEDKYISKVSANTTIEQFINNLDTNADEIKILDKDDNVIIKIKKTEESITILDKDDNDATENYKTMLIGTNMKVMLSKDEYPDIKLPISVIGDISGNGKVEADDLADTILKTLDIVTLNEIQIISVDFDEDNTITAVDLAEEIKLTLE